MNLDFKLSFSLNRLLVGIGIIALTLGVAISFPLAVASIALLLLLVAPVATVIAVAYWWSCNRIRTTYMLLTGVSLGLVLPPRVQIYRQPTIWEAFQLDWETFGLYVLCGALVLAIVDYIVSIASPKVST